MVFDVEAQGAEVGEQTLGRQTLRQRIDDSLVALECRVPVNDESFDEVRSSEYEGQVVFVDLATQVLQRTWSVLA